MTEAAGVLDAWVRGWVVSRVTPAATAVPGGWHVAVGADTDRERTFLRSPDELPSAAERSVSPPSRIACLVDLDRIDDVRAPTGWRMRSPDWFMVGPAPTTSEPGLPRGFHATVVDEGPRALIRIEIGDQLAASGQVGVRDGVAVPDRIETEAPFRRRGLGRALMRMLASAAVERGAVASIIAASADGRALYETLGWRAASRFPSFGRSS